MPVPQIFSVARDGDVLVVTVLCSVSSLADADILDEVQQVLDHLREPGLRGAVVDLARSGYFGSSMLEALRVIWNEVCAIGGRMALCNVSDVCREILEVARFNTIWPIVPALDDALQVVRAAEQP